MKNLFYETLSTSYLIPHTLYLTPLHKMIAKWDGEWTSNMSTWMQPGAPPTKSTGSVINKMILGGRYQESKFKGDFMGMPFEGVGLLGYDNIKKSFNSTWADNMGSAIMYMDAKWDDNSKSISFTGKTVDPMSGKEIAIRETFKIIDDNTQLMGMFVTNDGKEFKSMEIKFTRK